MNDIWLSLTQEPLLWLTATVALFVLSERIYQRAGRIQLLTPSLLTILFLAALLYLTNTPYETYFSGAKFIYFLLGPATVCLALPLYQNLDQVKKSALPIVLALFVGCLVAMISALGIVWAFGLSDTILASVAPKSVTAAVAIAIAEENNGSGSLAALSVLITGIGGAIIAPFVLNLVRVDDWRARGFAVGMSAHGFGTARALQVNATAGAFAGLGMGLNSFLTAILVPLVLHWFL